MKNFLYTHKNYFYTALFFVFLLILVAVPRSEVSAAATCTGNDSNSPAQVTSAQTVTQVFGNPIVCSQFCSGSCSGTNGICTYTSSVGQVYSNCSAYCSAGYVPQQSSLGYCVTDSNTAISCLNPTKISDNPIGGGWCQVTNSCTGIYFQTALYQVSGSCQASSCVCNQNQINDVSSGLCDYTVNGATTMTEPAYFCGAVDTISITLSPALRSITKGSVTSYLVSISSTYVGTLALTVSGCPGGGASCTLSGNNLVFASGSSDDSPPALTLNVANTAGVTAGTYTLTVSGTGAGTASGSAQLTINDTAPTNQAECVSIDAPNSVPVGSTFSATVVMKNTGTRTWQSVALNPTNPDRLGSQNPQDNEIWGLFRRELPVASVSTGGFATFNFNATAPLSAGVYPFDWEMVREIIGPWYPDICSKSGGITVSPAVIPATANITANNLSTDGTCGLNCITIPNNSSATLGWSYSGASSCTITPPAAISSGYPNGSGSVSTGSLSAPRTYTLSCLPAGSGSVDTIRVEVLPEPEKLNIIKSGQGRVRSVPAGIDCGVGCQGQSVEFPPNITVTLTATPATGRIFSGWSGGACSSSTKNADGSGGTCDVITDAEKTVFANFMINPNYKEF